MFRLFSPHFGTAAVAMVGLFLGLNAAQIARGQPGSQAERVPTSENPASGSQYSGPGGGQERGSQAAGNQASTNPYGSINQEGGTATVVCPGGCHGGFHPFTCRAYAGAGYYGFFHRYYGYPFYGPTYRSGAMNAELGYGLVNGVVYRAGAYGDAACPAGTNSSSSPATSAPASNSTRAANAAYLQIIVPRNAEVLVDGGKTTPLGTIREFVSPPLDPEKSFTYTIAVHGTDANGKTIEENRSIRVRANDQLRIDFTRPGSAERLSSSVRPAQ